MRRLGFLIAVLVLWFAFDVAMEASQSRSDDSDCSAALDSGPNEEFRDLLSSPLFSGKFGGQRIPFGKEITIDALVDLPIGNAASRMRRWGLVHVSTVDGHATDQFRTRFFLSYDKAYTDLLKEGEWYRLKGSIRYGGHCDGWSTYCFKLSDKPQRLEDEGLAANANPTEEPRELDELVGEKVELIGTALSLNGCWWLEYAGQRVIISQIRQRPGWDNLHHGVEIRVKGELAKELRPSLKQISHKTCRDLVPEFVIKQAEMEFVSWGPSLGAYPELHDAIPSFRDGVLELHDNSETFCKPAEENLAALSWNRNLSLVAEIIQRDSPTTRAVLRNRMKDESREYTWRLLDAGMLAAMNDETGREFLLKESESDRADLRSVYWVIGHLHQFSLMYLTEFVNDDVFGGSGPEMEETPGGRLEMTKIARRLFGTPAVELSLGNVDMGWAEQLMIDAIGNNEVVKTNGFWPESSSELTRQTLAVDHGSFPYLLVAMKSKEGIARMHEVAAGNSDASYEVLLALLRTEHPGVIRLAKDGIKKYDPSSWDRDAFHAYLFPKDPEFVVDDLIDSIDQGVEFHALYSLGRDLVLARLDAKWPEIKEHQRENARLLKLLFAEDPRAALLEELDRDDGVNPQLVFSWLDEIGDGAVAEKVAELLRTSSSEIFESKGLRGSLVIPLAIDACAVEGSRESLVALVSLLGEMDRFDITGDEGGKESSFEETPQDYDCYVAAKLIELTDVSFGTDKARWEKWLAEQVE